MYLINVHMMFVPSRCIPSINGIKTEAVLPHSYLKDTIPHVCIQVDAHNTDVINIIAIVALHICI